MAVITISREPGSEGTEIGRRVAQALGYHFVDKTVIGNVLQEYGFVELDDLYRTAPGFWARFDQANLNLVRMLNQVILAVAQHGDVVIVGRGGFIVLAGYADVLNVFIQAPFGVRAQRLMARHPGSESPGAASAALEQVEARLQAGDQARQGFLQAFYNSRGDSASAFHLVIDTGMVYPDMAASWIVDAGRALSLRQPGGKTARNIPVDPVLARTVAGALRPVSEPV
jgi:cytidylate kinase